MRKIKISIIIVNYKVREKLLRCILSIYNSKLNIPHEIIIVDNERDNSLENEFKEYKQVRYILSKKNLGFGGGNNLGAIHAKGEYLFFLNPDTVVEGDAIYKLYEFIKSEKNIGIVSPLMVDSRLNTFNTQSRKELTPVNAIYSFSFLRKIFPKKSIYNDPFFKKWDKTTPIETDTVPGAALVISKNLFDKVNGFDERFFLYFEENDLSKRIKKLGYKLFIYPRSKIIHKVGQSTKQIKERKDIFKKSRFLYFKKHYGLIKALPLEFFLRLNKNSLIVSIILFIAIFLRTVNLSISMPFIGDQGWFYLSARDLLINGNIPLVGITSSHTWLHQGPLWTYILGFIFLISNFNPVAPAYLTGIFGVLSTFLIYKVGGLLFSRQTGLVSALLYAVSPLVVFYTRMPYHTTLIPFFSLLLILSVYKWLKGKIFFFPAIILVLSILYNFELATTSLWLVPAVFIAYGIYKKSGIVFKLLDLKIILLSAVAFVVPMFPVLVYDVNSGFPQTFKFIGWIGYKFLRIFGFPSVSTITEQSSYFTVLSFLFEFYKRLIFPQSNQIAAILLLMSFSIFFWRVYKEFKNKNLKLGYIVLVVYFLISLIGFLVARTPSEAYLPIFFPSVILITGLFFEKIITNNTFKFIGILFLFALVSFNVYSLFANTFSAYKIGTFDKRLNATNKIIQMTNGKKYNLIGKGEGSQFESFTMNYEYLLWWKGHPPSKSNEKFKIYISETPKGIIIRR